MTLNYNYDCSNEAVAGIAGNVSGLCEGRASEYKSSNLVQKIIESTNVQ